MVCRDDGMATIEAFTDLEAWKEAHKMVLYVYKVSKTFPSDEKFGLTSQIRRAAVSISSNIAEGFGRRTAKDKIQFYIIARSSLLEIESQMLIARDLQYLDSDVFQSFRTQRILVGKLLSGLIKSASTRAH